MNLEARLANRPGIWRPKAPANVSVLASLSEHAPVRLPAEYVSFLSVSNGGEGELAVEPGWVLFWPAEEVLDLNLSYEVPKMAPSLFGFGSNGGGELLAFDTRAGLPYSVVSIPFLPLDPSLIFQVATDFSAFLLLVGASAPAA